MTGLVGDAVAALQEIFTRPFRLAALKIVAITLGLLVVGGSALHGWLAGLVAVSSPWLATTLAVVEGLGLAVGSVFLVAPTSALVAGFFVDDLAAQVERDLGGPEGHPIAIGVAVGLSVRFAALTLAVVALALLLLFVPGVNAVAFLGANAYLSGRQYFEFAALRFRSAAEVAALRRNHAGLIFAGGFCIALLLSVPLLNLLAPLFGTALMVRLHRRMGRGAMVPRSWTR